jgi:hypothetical protein
VQVANQLVNLMGSHAKRLDTDMEEFAAELSANGEDPNDMLAGGLPPTPYPSTATMNSPFPLTSHPSGSSARPTYPLNVKDPTTCRLPSTAYPSSGNMNSPSHSLSLAH